MYSVAVSVASCVRAGTRADVVWIVDSSGLGHVLPDEALVVTPGGGVIGGLAQGRLNDAVVALVGTRAETTGRLIEVEVDPVTAIVHGLPEFATATCLCVPAAVFPDGFWEALWAGEASCLVTEVAADGAVASLVAWPADQVVELGDEIASFFAGGVTRSLIEPATASTPMRVITALWPRPRLALIGGGPFLDAIEANAALLEWEVLRSGRGEDLAPLLLGFGEQDMVVVAAHDLEVAGNALLAALAGHAGYLGALGSAAMTEARRDWLTRRGATGLDRIHGPAGLDIGARRPAEVAVAVIAEAMATRQA